MKKKSLLIFACLAICVSSFAQRTMSEKIGFFNLRTPNNPLDQSIKTYNVIVETPYTLTVEELNTQSLADFEVEKANYAQVVIDSEAEFEERLAGHEEEVKKAEARYDKEMANFKELSLLERLALTEQGKKPALKVPSKPTYVAPREPVYIQPNLDDHLIFDNQVLADNVALLGFEKGSDLLIVINITKMAFQDNGGQTFYAQPTNLKVMQGATIIDEKTFDDEFQFLTSSNSNTINLDRYEKNNVKKIMTNIGTYINEEFGFIPVASSVTIEFPKNKKREYDILENAKIKAISAFRKMKKDASSETRERATAELMAVRDIWTSELAKVDYNDKKALMNKDIAIMLFYNLMQVDINLKDKAQAEVTLAAFQEQRINLDLNYDEKNAFTKLEEQIYKL
ncbi:hypothetical protein [Psychroserpens damuponensis]|uniref:hypothetical protein n=1 Tax=Psychroserpens damuponensis TaxID=943936 RepID=UPI00126A2595|nr:hypothetical protein [Psychroserpens damuponensis]